MNPYGLPNNGNLCYMNTALQTIVCIYGDLFISGKCKKNEKVNKFLKRFTYLVDVIENRDGKWSKKYVNKYITGTFASNKLTIDRNGKKIHMIS